MQHVGRLPNLASTSGAQQGGYLFFCAGIALHIYLPSPLEVEEDRPAVSHLAPAFHNCCAHICNTQEPQSPVPCHLTNGR